MFPELNGTKFCSRSFHLQISDILQTRTDQSEDHMKINFGQFNNKYHKQLELKKEMKKVGSFVLFPFFFPDLCSLNFQKQYIFANLCWPQQEIKFFKQFISVWKGSSCFLRK